MELQQDKGLGPFIAAYEAEELRVEQQVYHSSILVHAEKQVHVWRPFDLADLQAQDFQDIISLNPNLILLGTGKTLVFPESELLAPLYNACLGVEIMDTAAACRTYNVLMAEGRNVLAALLLNCKSHDLI